MNWHRRQRLLVQGCYSATMELKLCENGPAKGRKMMQGRGGGVNGG